MNDGTHPQIARGFAALSRVANPGDRSSMCSCGTARIRSRSLFPRQCRRVTGRSNGWLATPQRCQPFHDHVRLQRPSCSGSHPTRVHSHRPFAAAKASFTTFSAKSARLYWAASLTAVGDGFLLVMTPVCGPTPRSSGLFPGIDPTPQSSRKTAHSEQNAARYELLEVELHTRDPRHPELQIEVRPKHSPR